MGSILITGDRLFFCRGLPSVLLAAKYTCGVAPPLEQLRNQAEGAGRETFSARSDGRLRFFGRFRCWGGSFSHRRGHYHSGQDRRSYDICDGSIGSECSQATMYTDLVSGTEEGHVEQVGSSALG